MRSALAAALPLHVCSRTASLPDATTSSSGANVAIGQRRSAGHQVPRQCISGSCNQPVAPSQPPLHVSLCLSLSLSLSLSPPLSSFPAARVLPSSTDLDSVRAVESCCEFAGRPGLPCSWSLPLDRRLACCHALRVGNRASANHVMIFPASKRRAQVAARHSQRKAGSAVGAPFESERERERESRAERQHNHQPELARFEPALTDHGCSSPLTAAPAWCKSEK